MRTALLLAGLLLTAPLLVVAPVDAGPVRDACDDLGQYERCDRVLLPCRSTDPALDHVCTQYYNPTVGGL